ncbi:unnamed protein product [Didymodactylos carnosus]|uniref:G-protein coupled receptors family 1 profile domain-containing protein n=2 Tax=Didymodactylos carnosus TaxID=1234261 RepID=A0A8S2KZ44_9BILA|nr:unnamed protein product [Didymodactylos carnosus]CAF3862284.1 unnamed protein product [Didymodactylos carnosus]
MNYSTKFNDLQILNDTLPVHLQRRYYLVIRILSIYALCLVITGTVGNVLTITVLTRRNLWRYVTMRYLTVVSLADIISLYGWNLNNFYKFTLNQQHSNLEDLSLIHCRLVSYMSFVGLQLSSWCLTAVSLDRSLSLYSLSWKQKWGKLSRTVDNISILTCACLLLNCHILFLNGYRDDDDRRTTRCYATKTNAHYIFPQWERVHLVMYNLCPFCIMLISNTYIIHVTTIQRVQQIKTQRSRWSIKRRRQLTCMLMLVTFAFIVLTLPSCIYFVFFRHHMIRDTSSSRLYRSMIQIILNSIQFTSHSINFFLYCFSSTNFRDEFRSLLTKICPIVYCSVKRKPSLFAVTKKHQERHSRHAKQQNERESTLEHQHTGVTVRFKDLQITGHDGSDLT